MLAVVRLRPTRAKLQIPSTCLRSNEGPFHPSLPVTFIRFFTCLSLPQAAAWLCREWSLSASQTAAAQKRGGITGCVCTSVLKVRICVHLGRFTCNGAQSLHAWLLLRLQRSPPDMQMASSLLGQNSHPNMAGCRSHKTQLRTVSRCFPPNGERVRLCLLVPLSGPPTSSCNWSRLSVAVFYGSQQGFL